MLMWYDRIFICFIYVILFFRRTSVVIILAFIFEFFQYRSRHDSNVESIIFSYITHSQPQMTVHIDEKN